MYAEPETHLQKLIKSRWDVKLKRNVRLYFKLNVETDVVLRDARCLHSTAVSRKKSISWRVHLISKYSLGQVNLKWNDGVN